MITAGMRGIVLIGTLLVKPLFVGEQNVIHGVCQGVLELVGLMVIIVVLQDACQEMILIALVVIAVMIVQVVRFVVGMNVLRRQPVQVVVIVVMMVIVLIKNAIMMTPVILIASPLI